ncbi:MAG: hypothetical protein PHQ75_09590, partial [Thermoguttaceae bacterium]|nr:hypothetical protein [Thermoguttaceae bacterium]
MKIDMRICPSWLSSLLFLLFLTCVASSAAVLFAADDEEIKFDEPAKPSLKKTVPAVPTNNKTTASQPNKSVPAAAPRPASAITPSNPTLGGPRKLPPRTKTETTKVESAEKNRVQTAPQAQVAPTVQIAPLEDVVPVSALLMLRTSSLDLFERQVKLLADKVGFGAINPVDYIKFSAWGRSFPFLNRSLPAAVVYVADGKQQVPVFYLPVNDFKGFAKSLGASLGEYPGSTPVPDKKILKLRTPAGAVIWSDKNYAVILGAKKNSQSLAAQLITIPSWRKQGYSFFPSGFKRSDLSLDITSQGVGSLLALARSAFQDVVPLIQSAAGKMNSNFSVDGMPDDYLNKVSNIISWIDHNVSCLRIDFQIDAAAISTALNLIPLDNSELRAQIQDDSQPEVPVTLDLRRFLALVPDVPAPISGQIDLTASVFAKLEAPFNRIRHIEYSLSLPGKNELLTESWCFFLEVDDSQKFVEELIVPKAQFLGSRIGGDRLSELGAQILGNLAVRRQSRQNGRGYARRPADPERAASVGAELGERLGSQIGGAAGVKQAMKKYSFDNYPLYVTDVAFYTRQMRIIRAQDSGQIQKPPILLTGEPSLYKLITNIIDGVERGSLEGMIQNSFINRSNTALPGGEPPLLAKTNLILVLDSRRLLIVPGNEQLLRAAKDNWERVRDIFVQNYKVVTTPEGIPVYEPLPKAPRSFGASPQATQAFTLWQYVQSQIPQFEKHKIRTVTRIEPVNVRFMGDYLRAYYVPDLPQWVNSKVSHNTPSL